MVKKKARDPLCQLELHKQVSMLSKEFEQALGLGNNHEGQGGSRVIEGQVMNWSSSNLEQAKSGMDSDSVGSAPADLQTPRARNSLSVDNLLTARALISPPRYSVIGFEVDLTGSQDSDTPYLIPHGGRVVARAPTSFHRYLGARDERDVKRRLRHRLFKNKRDAKLHGGYAANKLIHSARVKLLRDLSLVAPESIEEIRALNPAGNGIVAWEFVKDWLEKRPFLTSQMRVSSAALGLMANYKGPANAAGSLSSLKLYATLACKWDNDIYKDVCTFLFPEEKQFARGRSC